MICSSYAPGMSRKPVVVSALLLLLLLAAGLVYFLTRTPVNPEPPWKQQPRSGIQQFLDAILGRGNMARGEAEHITVVATLRNITSAQAQFQASALADEDRDGLGEYGMFAELSAALPVRGTERPISPPVLSGAFQLVDGQGTVFRSSYRYRIFLPGPDGRPVGEAADGGVPSGELDPDLAELAWFCVVQPVWIDAARSWSYLVTESGDIRGKYGLANPEEAARFDVEKGRTVPAGEGWIPVE